MWSQWGILTGRVSFKFARSNRQIWSIASGQETHICEINRNRGSCFSSISIFKGLFWTGFHSQGYIFRRLWSFFTYPTMHLFHIPQCTIQKRNVHISVLKSALWDTELMSCGIGELIQLDHFFKPQYFSHIWTISYKYMKSSYFNLTHFPQASVTL